jgi:hypothetical protein
VGEKGNYKPALSRHNKNKASLESWEKGRGFLLFSGVQKKRNPFSGVQKRES